MKLRPSLVVIVLVATTSLLYAQQNSLSIGTNQINNKAVLWLVPNASGQGLLLPVVSTAVRNGMGLQAADRGMIVYDNTDNSVYLWNGTAWNNLAGGAATTFTGANGITVTGNTISTDAIRPTTNATGDLSGTFANPQIANNAITTAKIANDAVDNSKIANVNPAKLTQAAATNGQVLKWSGTAWAPADDLTAALTAGTGISIASNVITNTGLLTTSTAAGEVTGTFANLQIANGVVTDVKLADNSVTTAKIANNAVIASKIADGNVTTNKIADNAINTAKVQDANITTPKIADGAVTDAKLATGIAVNKLAPGTNGQVLTVAAGQASWQPAPSSSVPILANGQILTGNGTVNSPTTLTGDATLAAGALTIANNAVTTPKIANDAVTTAKILDANVTTTKLADGSVTGVKLAANAINDANIAAGANIAGSKLAGTVVLDTEAPATGDITGNFSTGLQIAANAVATTEINNLAVTDAKIAGVSASKLAGTVAVANGGTGLATTPGNGQLPIGNGAGYTLAPLTGGAGINIVNAPGSITISSTGLTNPMTAPGDIIYGGAGGTPTRLATGIGFLRGGSPPTYSNVNLGTLDVTGTLPVTNGGTGRTTWNGVVFGSGATLSDISSSAPGQLFISSATTPSWQTMSGDATINQAGIFTLNNTLATGNNIITAINAGNTQITGARINPAFGAQNISTTGTLTAGSTGQFTVSATGNVGIGQASPNAQLHLGSTVSNRKIILFGSGINDHQFLGFGVEGVGTVRYQTAAPTNDHAFYAGTSATTSAELMRITGTGNVGVGTATPVSKLDVVGDLRLAQGSAPSTTADKLYNVGGSLFWNGTNLSAASGWGLTGNTLTGTERIGSDNLQPLAFETNNTERMRLSAAGNLGIGTTNPLSTFQLGNTMSLFNDPNPSNQQDIFARNVSFDGTDFRYLTSAGASAVSLGNERLGLFTFASGTAGANILVPPTMRFNLTNVGVGIEVDNPDETLDVNGAVHLRDDGIPTTTTERLYNVGGSLFWGGINISSGGSGWSLGGNTGTVDGPIGTGTNFLGTRDDVPLNFVVNNQRAGRIESGTRRNTMLGFRSGNVTTGNFNSAFGFNAMLNTTTGSANTAVGTDALTANTVGNFNTAVGYRTLEANTGSSNTVVGSEALYSNTTGGGNTALGYGSLPNNTTGTNNTALGRSSLLSNVTGSNNTALGVSSGVTTVLGNANTSGSSNTFIGFASGPGSSTQLTNATAIGANAVVSQDNSLVLGSISGINGASANTRVGIGTSTPSVALDIQATDAMTIPDGTTAQRPAASVGVGAIRFNSDLGMIEYSDGTNWHSLVPPGTIVAYGGTTEPAGWLFCDGRIFSTATYPRLFAAIGVAYGSPSPGQFRVPDFRGKFLRGVDGSAGFDPDAASRIAQYTGGNGGNSVGSFQTDQIRSHTHNFFSTAALNASVGGNVDFFNQTTSQSRATTAAGGSETRPVNVYVNYIIKY